MPGDYYVWKVNGKPVSVHIGLSVIERLGAIIIENFRVAPGHSQDSAGLLLGRSFRDASGHVLAVDDFEPLDEMPGSLRSIRDQAVVGIYCGRSGEDLRLTPHDASIIQQLFKRPDLAFLLILPVAGAPARAGLFIQEQGEIQGFATYREFPFHAELLRTGGFPLGAGRRPRNDWVRTSLIVVAPVLAATAIVPTFKPVQPPATTVTRPATSTDSPVFSPTQATPLELIEIPSPIPPPQEERQSGNLKPTGSRDRKISDSRAPRSASRLFDPVGADQGRSTSEKPSPVAERPDVPDPPPIAAGAPPDHLNRVTRNTPQASVSLETTPPSRIRRMIQKVPGLRIVQRGRFKAGESFTPARPLRHAVPQLPQNLAARLTAETPVDLKLRIDTEGRVSTIEVLGAEAQPELARITSTAASRWTFEPARIANRPVESEVLAHFRFRPIE